ncbi:hypothetical protein EHV15_01785 [Paenibacillus oralis]|uniref:DUF1795 domain-containing protein n=1 Tax=Paenibacillus oralis TaxID=2490856 RepID=A0A3P3TVX8_9BACL|nr:hypothetical protein [Paenibacillus oralis]RRJ61846.1 hypothetical protein EHV15_01785 [Paenibacillus oralis]
MYCKLITLIALCVFFIAGCGSSLAVVGNNTGPSGLAAAEEAAEPVKAEETESGTEEGYVTIPGTSLRFVPQADFQQASGFAGYESLTHQTSLMAMEIPVPDANEAIDYFYDFYTADLLESRGLEFISKEKLNTAPKPQALLLKCRLVKEGVTYIQWVYILEGEGQKVGQIQAAAPEEQFNLIESEIMNMLTSFQWASNSSEADTYYSLDLPTGWKLAKQVGVMELYNKGGVFPLPAGEPSLGVTNLRQTVLAEERQKFLDRMNSQRNYYSELEVIDSKDVEIDGYPANFSYVSGIETETEKSVIKQYCYIFLDQTVIFIEADRSDELNEAEFERIALSWKLK